MKDLKITLPITYYHKLTHYLFSGNPSRYFLEKLIDSFERKLIIREYNFYFPIYENDSVEYYFWIENFEMSEYKLALKALLEKLLEHFFVDKILIEPHTSKNDMFYDTYYREQFIKYEGRIPYRQLIAPPLRHANIIEYESFIKSIKSMLTDQNLIFEDNQYILNLSKTYC